MFSYVGTNPTLVTPRDEEGKGQIRSGCTLYSYDKTKQLRSRFDRPIVVNLKTTFHFFFWRLPLLYALKTIGVS